MSYTERLLSLGQPQMSTSPQMSMMPQMGDMSTPVGGMSTPVGMGSSLLPQMRPVMPTAADLSFGASSNPIAAAAAGAGDMATGGGGGLFGNMNWDNLGVAMKGIGQLASIWGAFQTNKIARESLDFQKDAFKTNLNNQRKSYNTALADKANARYAQYGNPDGAASYIEKNKM